VKSIDGTEVEHDTGRWWRAKAIGYGVMLGEQLSAAGAPPTLARVAGAGKQEAELRTIAQVVGDDLVDEWVTYGAQLVLGGAAAAATHRRLVNKEQV